MIFWVEAYLCILQRQEILDQDEDDTWDQDQPQPQPQQSQDSEMKPVWIADTKNNIKYAITRVNYSQVVNFINYLNLLFYRMTAIS